MANKNRNDENTIYIQYCRSCDTHSWCTHHDEAKYHQTFLKLSEMMAHRMPEVEVIGNMVPTHLIPFKIAENKYIDANTNKYVVYPQIGSFEVIFRGKLVFSKKQTHTWPNLPTIVSKISNIANPEYQSPTKQEPQIEEDKETSKVSNNNSFLDSEEDKKTNYKTQQKGFTLTDHFKMYRPKNTFQDKDWLTQKQESQASLRQISEMGRVQSREKSEKKSDKSLQSKKSSDIVGQSKLKQMLKHKGMITKDQGKKEMIIRLDSIEQQNIFEEAAAATQRTQQKNVKKNNKMKQIDDQINALDSKFKNFETRVHDIQARNQQFQMKPGSSNANTGDDKSRFKQIIQNKRDQMERNLSTKKSQESEVLKQAKQKAFADKTNKLQQYLNYSEQEKNDKLHRIYGEWKLIKQFNSKNKKLLRAKDKETQDQQIDDSESQSASKNYSRSQSPNSFGNIITFKQKNQKILKIKNLKNQKEHKYSSVQRYHVSSQLGKDMRNQTDQHFYNNRKFIKPRAEIQSEVQVNPSHHPISKLIKKSVNTLSMNALKSLANNQSNLPKIESEINSVQNFSTSAKANINKINNRISNIQQKLKNHNNATIEPTQKSPYADRERNLSKKSQSQSGSEHNVSIKKLNKIYNGLNNKERNSNESGNTIKKNYSNDKIKNSNFSEVARPQTKKMNDKSTIKEQRQEEYKPHQSKRKDAKYIDGTEDDPVVRDSPKKISSNSNNRINNVYGSSRKVSKSKESQIRHSKQVEVRRSKQVQNSRPSKQADSKITAKQRKMQQVSALTHQPSQRKTLKEKRSTEQLAQNQPSTDPKRGFRERKVQDHKQRKPIQNEQPRKYSETIEQQEEQNSYENQHEFHPHQARQPKPLERKFKDWKESSPTKNLLKSKEVDRQVKQGINEKIRESDSKQTVVRSKKIKNKNNIEQNQSIISSNGEEIQNKSQTLPVEQKKVRSGQIKRNRIPKQSNHKEPEANANHGSKEKAQIKRGQIKNQYAQSNQFNSQRTEENEDAEYSFNNDSQQIRQPSNRFSSENEYQSTNNYERSQNASKVTGVNDQKLRKTLGYFKVNELCYRGVKTSEENRSGEKKVKQTGQASFYETQNQDEVEQDAQQYNHDQNQENSQSQESEFVPECKKRCQASQGKKEETEQGWKAKSDSENDEMLPQEIEEMQSQKNGRKNSLQQKLQKNNIIEAQQEEANEDNEVHTVQSQKIVKDVQQQYNNEQAMRPQTTQEVCNFSQEKINNQEITKQSPKVTQEEATLEKVLSEGQQKQTQYQNDFQNTSQNAPNKAEEDSAPLTPVKRQSTKPKINKQVKKQKQSLVDVELIVCKQYSEYLSCKISNQLCKVIESITTDSQKVKNDQQNAEKSNEPTQQAKVQEQVPVAKTEQQQEIANFMSFQPSQPVVLEEKTAQIQQNENQYEEQQYNDEQEQLVTAQKAQIEQQDGRTQEKITEQPVNKQKQSIASPVITGVQGNVSIAQPASAVQGSHVAQAVPKVSAVQSNTLSLQTQSKPLQTKKEQALEDNVYCDTKSQNPPKFMQIGVQKQLTLEVSIQTESFHQNDKIITARNPIPATTEEEEKRSARSHVGTPQQENVFSEFEGTIRNNYLNETKNSFHPDKSRREPLRAKITNQIFSESREKQMQKFASVISGSEALILKKEGAVAKMSAVYPQGVFMGERSLEVEQVKTKFSKFLKALEILAERGEWILNRLFEDPKGILQERAFGVWLSLNFQWECFVVDDCIQVEENNKPLFTIHSGNQKWANVLEKAVARAVGGYEKLQKADCAEIFTLLTGCNSISVKVKEDPSKNNKLLQLINECQRKNYIVHAEKSWERNREQKDNIYYVLSVRRSNSEEEALLQISQDGRESFWMRLSKFTQEFSKVQILQLRVNHNFTHIDLGIGKENKLTVVELAFTQSGQGCVTLNYIDHVGPLTAYLYREEKSRVLKLVGQARERQKSHLFFECNFNEGRYYVFAQTKEKAARLAYYGENSPALRITEEIHNDGLKNEVAEYLPIHETKEKPRREMEDTWNDWKGKTPRLKDNFMQSRLRENFVEYILGHNKRKDNQF